MGAGEDFQNLSSRFNDLSQWNTFDEALAQFDRALGEMGAQGRVSSARVGLLLDEVDQKVSMNEGVQEVDPGVLADFVRADIISVDSAFMETFHDILEWDGFGDRGKRISAWFRSSLRDHEIFSDALDDDNFFTNDEFAETVAGIGNALSDVDVEPELVTKVEAVLERHGIANEKYGFIGFRETMAERVAQTLVYVSNLAERREYARLHENGRSDLVKMHGLFVGSENWDSFGESLTRFELALEGMYGEEQTISSGRAALFIDNLAAMGGVDPDAIADFVDADILSKRAAFVDNTSEMTEGDNGNGALSRLLLQSPPSQNEIFARFLQNDGEFTAQELTEAIGEMGDRLIDAEPDEQLVKQVEDMLERRGLDNPSYGIIGFRESLAERVAKALIYTSNTAERFTLQKGLTPSS